MKNNINISITLFGIVSCLVFLGSCSDDNDLIPSQQDLVFEALSGAWMLNNGAGRMLLDGKDVSANFPQFSLSFDDGSYTTTNGGNLFDATGTWEWLDENAQQLKLSDGKEVTIDLLNEHRFTFKFTQGGARAAGLPGAYIISVVR